MPLGAPFFDAIRRTVTGGQLSARQVDGLNHIWAEWERRKLTDLRWAANIIAQSFWESDRTWQPILESGGQAYLQSKKYYPYIGAGLIQVTWRANYQKFGAEKAEDLLGWPIALRALFDGMIKGMFTKYKLADFFNDSRDDPKGARQIVNGHDREDEIAAIHNNILRALFVQGAVVTQEAASREKINKAAKGAIVAGGAAGTGAIINYNTGGNPDITFAGGLMWLLSWLLPVLLPSTSKEAASEPPRPSSEASPQTSGPAALTPMEDFKAKLERLQAAQRAVDAARQVLEDHVHEVEDLLAQVKVKVIEHEPPALTEGESNG
jgi:hypothetical protein